jgi:DNA-binding NarL/FixJ family response regulator
MNKIPVCIVEDVTDIRQALEQIIALSDSCELYGSFASGEEALLQLPALMPRVVLMDIGLGGLSGIEVVRILKNNHPDLLFLMCTVYEEDEKIFDALRAGASGYILKKSSPSKLIDAINELNEGGSPMSSQIARKVVTAFQNLPVLPDEVPTEQARITSDNMALLTKREKEILDLLAKGHLVKEIAQQLSTAPDTVRKHLYHIYEKLHVNNKVEAVNKYLGR